MIAIPAAFTRPTGAAHWHVMQRARAIEASAFVVAAAQVGRHADGREMNEHDWQAGYHGTLGIGFAALDEDSAVTSHNLLVLVNRLHDSVGFSLPPGRWRQLIDSASHAPFALQARQGHSLLMPQSIQILLQEHGQ